MTIIHERTGWSVDPATGVVYGARRRWAGKPIGSVAKNGYRYAQTNGKDWLLHRVVWEASRGPIPDGLTVNHLNGIKTDNRLSNLALETQGENNAHAYRIGLRSRYGGSRQHCENHHAAKLTHEQVAEIKHAEGKTQAQLASRFGVHQRTIWRIRSGKGWACVN